MVSDQNRYSVTGSLVERSLAQMKVGGPRHLGQKGTQYLAHKVREVATPAVRPFRRNSTFRYRGSELSYVSEKHNSTWANERSLELAIARMELESERKESSIEVGSVLSHYREQHERPYAVIDKYERGLGVVNADLLEYVPAKKYSFMVSISTFEHIGVDEHDVEPDPSRAVSALLHARDFLLAPGGRGIVTFPIGHNSALDELLVSGFPAGVATVATYKRLNRWNDWAQCEPDGLRGVEYGRPFRNANGLVVLEVNGESAKKE